MPYLSLLRRGKVVIPPYLVVSPSLLNSYGRRAKLFFAGTSNYKDSKAIEGKKKSAASWLLTLFIFLLVFFLIKSKFLKPIGS